MLRALHARERTHHTPSRAGTTRSHSDSGDCCTARLVVVPGTRRGSAGSLQNRRIDMPSVGVLTNGSAHRGKLGMGASADRARMTNGWIATGLGVCDKPMYGADWLRRERSTGASFDSSHSPSPPRSSRRRPAIAQQLRTVAGMTDRQLLE